MFGYSENTMIDIGRDVLLNFGRILFGNRLSVFANDLLTQGRKVAIEENFLIDLFFVHKLIVFSFHLLELLLGRLDSESAGVLG